ncbi:MAG: SDR family NAD(P)-dependent oxidoreductase, partial [Pseudomonadota bacterium]
MVTGASSGIGRVITLGLLKAGMRVAVCARRL